MSKLPAKTRRIREPLPWLVDEIARTEPGRSWCSIPVNDADLSKGYRDITFTQASRAVDRYCEFLEKHVGRNELSTLSVICYVGLMDSRCLLITLAASKLGHTVLHSAPRNSLPMHQSLFENTACHTLIYDTNLDPKQISGDRQMKAIVSPSLRDLLDDESPDPQHYPYERAWENMKSETLTILHTSGSTGMPKPMFLPHDHCASIAEQRYISRYHGRNGFCAEFGNDKGHRMYSSFPPFHLGGLFIIGFAWGIYGGVTQVFGPAHLPPSGQVLMDVVDNTKVKSAVSNPAALMELAKSKEGLQTLAKLDAVLYGGGVVDKASGDAVSKVTRLQSVLGSTECAVQGFQLVNLPGEQEWDAIHYAPDQGGVEFQEQAPGIYEMVFIREPSTEDLHACWKLFPQLGEYRTKDLFSKHPTLPNRWKFEGRIDDLIAFQNASKYNPLHYEERIQSNRLVRSAFMFGVQRPYPGLLVELFHPIDLKDAEKYQAALEMVWETVQAVNADAPKHAQVRKHMIMLAEPARPFERAPKGTPIRQRTLKLYEGEVDGLYKASQESTAPAPEAITTAAR